MEKLEKLYSSLLKTQEEFFEKLASLLKEEFYFIENVSEGKASVSFDLDLHYEIRFEGVDLILYDKNGKYNIKDVAELYTYLKIRYSAVKKGDDNE